MNIITLILIKLYFISVSMNADQIQNESILIEVDCVQQNKPELIPYDSLIIPPKTIVKVIDFKNINGNEKIISAEFIGGKKGIEVKIIYPEIAKRAGIEGKVILEFEIDENGLPDKIKIIKGIGGGCEENAAESILSSRFKPAKLNSKNLKSINRISILFKLPN